MSTKIGDNLDEIYASHQVNIENELQQMVKRFECNVNGESNESNMRSFFDSLSQRTRDICQRVRVNCMTELIGQPSDDIDNELDEDDLNQIINLLEQIDDCSDNDDVEMIDECTEPIVKLDKAKPEPQRIRSDIPKKRRYSMFQESSPLFEETKASRISKLRRLSTVNEQGVGYPKIKPTKPLKSDFKTTLATIPSRSDAILNALSNAAGVIRAFCFWCNQKLAISLCDWKVHYLKHTKEEAFFCTGCNEAMASNEREHCTGFDVIENFGQNQNELNVFMCVICNFIQVNMDRIVEHIKTEHGNDRPFPEQFLKKLMLLPDLKPISKPIPTKYHCLSLKNRYQCVVDDCKRIFQGSTQYKTHFMRWHKAATKIVCPHCDEVLMKNQRDDTSFDILGIVLNNLYRHGNIVNQCYACKEIFPNDFNVLKHLLDEHGHDECRYRRDIRDIKGICRMEEVMVLFECNVCEHRADTSNQAIQHFLNRHKSHHVDSTLIQFLKETNPDAITQYVMILRGQTWKLEQHFVCGWCKTINKTKSCLNRHYELVHQSQHLLIELSKNYLIDSKKSSKSFHRNLAIDQYLMYYCWHCSNSNHSTGTFYSDIDKVYDHWSCTHADHSDNPKPFRFTVAPLVRCHFCDVISTFVGMKKHQAEQHSTKPFVFENLIDRTKCGLCLDGGEVSIVKHFDTNHQVVLRTKLFNPITLNRDTLKKLMDLKGHKKRKCTYCSMVFELKTEFYRHHHEKHTLLIAKSDKIYDNESIHLITGCCNSKIQSNQSFGHFKGHNITSKNRLKTYYWKTMVVFGNGLVLNKHNLLGSKYDDSKEIENFIKETMEGK